LGLRIRVSGHSGLNQEYATTTRTVLVSRHGAKIILEHDQVPQGGLNIGCLNTNKEAEARLVGFMGEEPEGPSYGIEFLDKKINLWNIEFPSPAESGKAVARTLLRCQRCGTTELAYLNETEAIIFQFREYVPRPCETCHDLCLWEQMVWQREWPLMMHKDPEAQRHARRGNRFDVPFTACIRSRKFGQEVVPTRNISRGGINFKSVRGYETGDRVEVAVPYAHNSGNIFVPGRIAYHQPGQAQRLHQYGVAYVGYGG
jgi:hypothetical protein